MSTNRLPKVGGALILLAVAVGVAAWTLARSRSGESEDSGARDATSRRTLGRSPRPAPGAPGALNVVSVREATSSGLLPLPDVVVTLHHRGTTDQTRSTSDADGRASFDVLSDGSWAATASTRGHEPASTMFSVSGGAPTAPVELVLRKRAVVHGVVRDAAGEPVAGARVVIHPPLGRSGDRARELAEPAHGLGIEATTDDVGRFVLPDAPVGGEYVLWAGHPVRGLRTFRVPELQAGEDRTIDVEFEPVATVHGEIPADVLGDGRGVVDLMARDGKGLTFESRLDVDPRNREYRFFPVLAGEKLMAFTVRRGARFYAGFQTVVVAEGEHVELGAWRPLSTVMKLRLTPQVEKLRGRDADLLVDDSEGEPTFDVRLMHVRVPIGEDITLEGLEAGKVYLSATPLTPDGRCTDSRDGTAQCKFDFDGRFVERELVLIPSAGLGPKGDAHFLAKLPDGTNADDACMRWILWSGRDALSCLPRQSKGLLGFSSGVLPAGRYRVEAYGEGLVATKEYDQADHDTEWTIGAADWTTAQSLSGVVRDGGEPARGATVVLSVKNESGEQFDVAEAPVAPDGSFEFRSLPRTTALSVFASAGRKASARAAVSGFQSVRDLVLELK